jgi:single-stranded DNA-binding protein
MNNINIIGNLTADPIKGEESNEIIAYFTVAVNRISSDKADFFHCRAKGKQAENLLKYKKKGDKLGVSGWMYSYNKKGEEIGGEPVDRWIIAAMGIDYCDSRRVEAPAQQPAQEQPAQPQQEAVQTDSSFRRRR